MQPGLCLFTFQWQNCSIFGGNIQPIANYLYIYRNHKPKIALCEDVVRTLDALKAEGVRIGLITDGRSVQQRNKVEALGLGRWIENADIVVSEEIGSEKPALANYEYFMKRYPECQDFTYVGDNPRKDFIAPNALGWMTICLMDDGRNIHRHEVEGLEEGMMPMLWIDKVTMLRKNILVYESF